MPETVLKSLDIMWKGMLAIFIVIFIIAIATIILQKCDLKGAKNRILKDKKAEEEAEAAAKGATSDAPSEEN